MFYWLFSWSTPVLDYILKILRTLLQRFVSCLLLPLLNGLISHPSLPLLHRIFPVHFPLRPTHSCGMGTNSFTGSPQNISDSPTSYGIPWISAQNLLNRDSWRGFVNWYPIIFPNGKCSKVTSPTTIKLLIKKYHTKICFVRWVIDSRQFFPKSIILRFSWYRIYSLTVKPCALIKYHVQRNPGRASSGLEISNSVDIFVVIFCFFGMLITLPRPSYILASFYHLITPCTTYKAYTHHLIAFRLSELKISGMYIVPHRYWSNYFRLHQLSFPVYLTLVVKKTKAF